MLDTAERLFTIAQEKLKRKKAAIEVTRWLHEKGSDTRTEQVSGIKVGDMAIQVLNGLTGGLIFFVVKDDVNLPPIKARLVEIKLPSTKLAGENVTLCGQAVGLQVRTGTTAEELLELGDNGDRELAKVYWENQRIGFKQGRITTDMPIIIKDPSFGRFPQL